MSKETRFSKPHWLLSETEDREMKFAIVLAAIDLHEKHVQQFKQLLTQGQITLDRARGGAHRRFDLDHRTSSEALRGRPRRAPHQASEGYWDRSTAHARGALSSVFRAPADDGYRRRGGAAPVVCGHDTHPLPLDFT